jgi:cytochrome c-type biogenesis protein CcmH/NrfG
MAIEGPLRELGIHDVFQLLDLSRKTGVLRVASELRDDEGVVYFDSGRVVHAHVRSKALPMELTLLQAGKITQDDLESAKARRTNGRASTPLVDLLVEQGVVTHREIERQMRLQIESVVFELMSWREGFFSFEERSAADLASLGETRIRISTESLLMEGARRIDEWSRIADKVPSLAVVPVLAPVREDGQASQLDLLPPEWEVLSMIDGVRDLRAIAGVLGRGEFDVARVVYGLVTTGVVEIRAPDRGAAQENGQVTTPLVEQAGSALARGATEEALTAARTALTSDASNTRARLLAARALGALNRRTEAVDELRRAVRADPLTPEVHLELGFAAVHVGDFGSARASWEHYLRLAPNGAEVKRVRAAMEALTKLMHVLEAYAEAVTRG